MQQDSLGVYLSIPFCKAKCSFCNFASGVFAAERMDSYVDRLCAELRDARRTAHSLAAALPQRVDTVYFGGGTPSLLESSHLETIFRTLRDEFVVDPNAEITLEAAPGQLSEPTLAAAMRLGVDRISFGVQSFIDAESAAVGRLHTARECHAEIARMSSAGISRISLDLIAGLPHQTAETWTNSLDQAIHTGVDHLSVYLLEIDEDSRLGREAIARGGRYHASALPSEDATADWYQHACERLAAHGLAQYEISNFARPGFASRHNLKYWRREPYLGAGLDAHSMLRSRDDPSTAIRRANPSEMDEYLPPAHRIPASPLSLLPSASPGIGPIVIDRITVDQAFEESLFLGLRLNAGVDLDRLRGEFGASRVDHALASLDEVQQAGLVERTAAILHLTQAGRLASNEVFARLLAA